MALPTGFPPRRMFLAVKSSIKKFLKTNSPANNRLQGYNGAPNGISAAADVFS
jgi:hypothetical protein